jgi:hypothetical protein
MTRARWFSAACRVSCRIRAQVPGHRGGFTPGARPAPRRAVGPRSCPCSLRSRRTGSASRESAAAVRRSQEGNYGEVSVSSAGPGKVREVSPGGVGRTDDGGRPSPALGSRLHSPRSSANTGSSTRDRRVTDRHGEVAPGGPGSHRPSRASRPATTLSVRGRDTAVWQRSSRSTRTRAGHSSGA